MDPVSPATPSATPKATPPDTAPSPALRRLWWAAGLWAVAVVGATSWLVTLELNRHRLSQLDTAEFRLESLHATLDNSFSQLAALSRALSRQSAIVDFLKEVHIQGSELASDANRLALRDRMSTNEAVQDISRNLLDTAREFKITQIYLLDRFGTAIADGGFETATSLIGANYGNRQYYTSAVEEGSASQFAVGRITQLPGYFFSARIGSLDHPLGVLVVKQESVALSTLLDDPSRRILVTDRNGVVVMSNRPVDILGHIPMSGPMTLSADEQKKLYGKQPPEMRWPVTPLKIKDQAVTQVRLEDGRTYLARSRPLTYGGLTGWVLTPQEGEGALITAWVGGAAFLLVSGWGLLLMQAQRRKRLQAVTRGQQMLTHMAHALPLTVFRYELKPGQTEGQFTFIGQGLRKLLGVAREELTEDPSRIWRLMGRTDKLPPPEATEFSLMLDQRRVWIRSESQCATEPDGTRIYNGYWADIT
ncbi:MAG: hypothetical protein RI920_2158, partial [Pseudomonadota bacterium]